MKSDDKMGMGVSSTASYLVVWFGLVWYAKVTLCSGLVTAEQNTSVQTSNNVIYVHLNTPKWKIIAMTKDGTNCKYWCVRNCPICNSRAIIP